ncbi:MAG: Zn-dependent hydrolase [Paenibacillus sp.]|nr:Zn-dependent hydrolase [Paenibacillus sp.]
MPYEKEYVYKICYRYIEEHAAAGEWLEIKPGIRVCWGRSGHLLGSVWLMLEADGRRIFFSGDYTSESVLLAADTPSWPVSAEAAKAQFKDSWMDMVIADAAYGTDSEDNRPS